MILPLLLAATQTVAIRADRLPPPREAVRTMPAGALAEALLAPGHPDIVEVVLLPEGLAPPLPPGSPILLQVRLVERARQDGDRCTRRSWDLTLVRADDPQARDSVSPPTTWQRLPPQVTGSSCAVALSRYYRAQDVSPACAPVMNALAAASLAARRKRPRFPASIDDVMAREQAAYRAANPGDFPPADPPLTDARRALAQLPLGDITHVGQRLLQGSMLPALPFRGLNGKAADRCGLSMGYVWTVDVALAGNQITAIAMRRYLPPPF